MKGGLLDELGTRSYASPHPRAPQVATEQPA
jgi:hypothetical protein